MRIKVLALAGVTGLFLGAAVLLPVAASAAPAATPTASSGSGATTDFIAMLQPAAARTPAASGEAWVSLTGTSAKFTVQVAGLSAGAPHLSHIYVGAAGSCSVTAPGTVAASLTTSGDTSPSSAMALTRYPTAADYTYTRTFTVDPWVATAVKDGTAVLMVAGGSASTDPALCGAFVASQMVVMPKGAADTGGGATAAVSHPAFLTLGIAALLTAVGAALLAFRRRSASQSGEVVVTNGFRRMIR